jgi:hypothetical protein
MKVIDEDSNSSKAILFKGKHCFPLSPQADEDDDGSRDQMAVILQKVGKLTEHDMSFVRSEDALEYI